MTGIFDYPLYFEAFLWKIVFLESLMNALPHNVRILKIGQKSEKLYRFKDRGLIFGGQTVDSTFTKYRLSGGFPQ